MLLAHDSGGVGLLVGSDAMMVPGVLMLPTHRPLRNCTTKLPSRGSWVRDVFSPRMLACASCADLSPAPCVNLAADQLLQESTGVTGGQIAIRFPGDNTSGNDYQVPPHWERHWHIDGLGDNQVNGRQSLFGDIRNFTALV